MHKLKDERFDWLSEAALKKRAWTTIRVCLIGLNGKAKNGMEKVTD